MSNDLDNLIVQATNSRKYFISINYIEKERIQHHFVSNDFPLEDYKHCKEAIDKFIVQEIDKYRDSLIAK